MKIFSNTRPLDFLFKFSMFGLPTSGTYTDHLWRLAHITFSFGIQVKYNLLTERQGSNLLGSQCGLDRQDRIKKSCNLQESGIKYCKHCLFVSYIFYVVRF